MFDDTLNGFIIFPLLIIGLPMLIALMYHWNAIDDSYKPYYDPNKGYHSTGYTEGFWGRDYTYEKDKEGTND